MGHPIKGGDVTVNKCDIRDEVVLIMKLKTLVYELW